jgi:ribosomal protein S18 acetylase RimI-like enzyme
MINMKFVEMTPQDVGKVVPLYVNYYNNVEGAEWTDAQATKRITQILTMLDGYSIMMLDKTEVVGFAMGFFRQYDDVVGYTLDEIVIKADLQGQGLGTTLLSELERRVKEKGASCVDLQAVFDDMHERYYGKSGYKNAKNFVLKVKWFD